MEGNVRVEILDPRLTRKIKTDLERNIWVYKYTNSSGSLTFSIATHGEPNSGKLSLGGFRIVPEVRAITPGFSCDKEAIELAVGMEEKVYWSRILGIGGPLGSSNLDRIVGGKCVLLPSPGYRCGESKDFEMLEFGIACCKDFEKRSGVYLTTGQDLGHGLLSDGVTQSINYLNSKFTGSIVSNTGKPTAEGNFFVLKGMLKGCGIELSGSRVGLVGFGNIGRHLFERLRESNCSLAVLESDPLKRIELAKHNVEVFSSEEKANFLSLPFDAFAFNANGGSLDESAVAIINSNSRARVICGCENLLLADPCLGGQLAENQKLFCPSELCGMMGYLTAVEEYLCRIEKRDFQIESMYGPAGLLEESSSECVELVIKKDYQLSFEDAVKELYG